MSSDIQRLRRFTIAACTVLFAFFAISSVSSAAPVKISKSTYKVEVTGIHVYDWHEQSLSYPNSGDPWTTERGTVTYGFSTPKPYRFNGMKVTGDAPGPVKLPGFQWTPAIGTTGFRFKAAYQQNYVNRHNVPLSCGGELGPCTGNEKSGVETTAKKCRKLNQRAPFRLDYDSEGKNPNVSLVLESDPSMDDFCGSSYPAMNSVTNLPKFRLNTGLDDIAAMKKGEHREWNGKKELGRTSAYAHDLKKCPPMSGSGSQQCWTTEVKLEITRVK